MKKNLILFFTLILFFSFGEVTFSQNNVLNFDGTDDYVSIPNNALLNFGSATDFTLEAWVKITGATQDFDGIIAKGTLGNWTGYQMVVYQNKIAAEIRNSSGFIYPQIGLVGTTLLNDGNWHHVAMVVTRSSNNIKLYVDGNVETNLTDPAAGGNVDNTANMYIGTEREAGLFLPANIDEVRIWNVARTQTELQNNMNNGALNPSTTGLVALYHFDQGTAGGDNTGVTTLNDATSNSLNGTLNNFALTGSSSNWVSSDNPLPVELTSFSANIFASSVELDWETATEVNNYGFEIERQKLEDGSQNSEWKTIGFVQGHGNSNSPKQYTFTDNTAITGKYSYRLKQVDIDGKYEYSDVIEVDLGLPSDYSLSQNYPNPFNPSTKIKYQLPESGLIKLKVYDVLGEEVATLVNKEQTAGNYQVNFDASQLTSGVYIYTIKTKNFTSSKKMQLLK